MNAKELTALEAAEAAYIRAKRIHREAVAQAELTGQAVTIGALLVERLRTRLGVKPLIEELLRDGTARATAALEDLASEDLPTRLRHAGEQGGQGGGEDKGEAETLAHESSPSG